MPDLNSDGPHSPEHTAEAGQQLDDVTLFLSHATIPGNGGLKHPADAYSLAADLYVAASRFPQICAQLQRFTREQVASGRLYEAQGRDIGGQADRAVDHLDLAASAARTMTKALEGFQADIAGLGVREGTP